MSSLHSSNDDRRLGLTAQIPPDRHCFLMFSYTHFDMRYENQLQGICNLAFDFDFRAYRFTAVLSSLRDLLLHHGF